MTQPLQKLTGKQASHLQGLGHSMKPILQIGKSGVTSTLVKQVEAALETHELMKIKVLKSCPETPKQIAETLTVRIPCQLAQLIGKTLLLYKKREEEPKIVLPG